MHDFSFESAARRIYDSRSAQLFKEVLSSYHNGNYRATVVTLWSVVVCDLLYKLRELADLHGDKKAATLLGELEKKQAKNPKSPDWESDLIEAAQARLGLLSTAARAHLDQLQQERHLCAHPVVTDRDLLYQPTPEMARALVRTALDAVLTRPPMLSRDIAGALAEDVAARKDQLDDDEALEKYLVARFLRNMEPSVEDHVFRVLWKFVFKLSNADCDENRDVNLRVLEILMRRRPSEIREMIARDSNHFSALGAAERVEDLHRFLCHHPTIYEVLGDAAKEPVKGHAKTSLGKFATAFYLSESPEQHMKSLLKRVKAMDSGDERKETIDRDDWKLLVQVGSANGIVNQVYTVGICMYGQSRSYDAAYTGFSRFIKGHLSSFEEEHLRLLLKVIKKNNQVSERGKAQSDHKLVKERCEEVLPEDFDYSSFPEPIG